METDNINQLTLPSWDSTPTLKEQVATQYDLTPNWLDYTLSYPEPRFLLEYGGVPFAPLGGIQAITGQKKNGKTFLMCQLMAAILSGDSERMRANLPTLKLHPSTMESLDADPTVLYIDTEMEKLNTVKVVRRVQWLCGWSYNLQNPRLKALWLRAEESNAIRWGKTKQAIVETRPTAIFLDGIRDVIGDFNDNKESADLVSECMKMATEMNCCIFNVLHENPGSEKMRGHLGTELGNKVTDTFVSIKEKKDNVVTFTVKQVDARGTSLPRASTCFTVKVKQVDARGKDVPDWRYEITDDAGALGVPRIITPEQATTISNPESGMTDQEWAEIVKAMKQVINPPRALSYTTLRENLKKMLHVASDKARKYIAMAESKNVLINQDGKYLFNVSEGDAVIQSLPF